MNEEILLLIHIVVGIAFLMTHQEKWGGGVCFINFEELAISTVPVLNIICFVSNLYEIKYNRERC